MPTPTHGIPAPSMMDSASVNPSAENLLPVTARSRTRRAQMPSMAASAVHVAPVYLLFRHLIDQSVRDSIVGFHLGRPSDLSRDAMQWITYRGLGNGDGLSFDDCCFYLGI